MFLVKCYLLVGLNPCFTARATLSKLSRFLWDSNVRTSPDDIFSLRFPIRINRGYERFDCRAAFYLQSFLEKPYGDQFLIFLA